MKSLEQRFLEKFSIGDECWEWSAQIDKQGYGRFWPGQPSRSTMAHRIAYELFVGPVPDGLDLDHLCRNRPCVRFDHLEAVTHAENVRRGAEARIAPTHCKRGHEYDSLTQGNGHRRCRECRRNSKREWARRARAK